jgi:hypothetical protein
MAYEDLKKALAVFQQRQPAQPEINWNYADAAQFQADMARHDQWLAAKEEHERMQAAARDRLWYSVQAFLVAAGNISKLLWPSDKSLFPERGPELRAGLEVEENSLLKPRIFRNHFEHFDERLERWAASSNPRKLADSNIGPVGAISNLEPNDRLRHFDPTTFAVTFRGDIYHLCPIIEAIQAIHQRATVKCRERAWGVSDQTQGMVGDGAVSCT